MRPSKQILARAPIFLLIAGAVLAASPSGEQHGIRRDGTLLRPGPATAPAAEAPALVRALDLLIQRAAHAAVPREDPRVLALVPLDRGWGSGTPVHMALRRGTEEVEIVTPAVTIEATAMRVMLSIIGPLVFG